MYKSHVSFLKGLLLYGGLTAVFSAIVVAVALFYIPNTKLETNTASLQDAVLSQPLTTDTWGIFDPNTGKVLASNNTDEVHPIASISKLFIALAVMQSDKQNDTFTIFASDVNTEGRSGKLYVGEKITPYELLFPLLIESSNDAAVAIARYINGSFEKTMNDAVATLPLPNTTIIEPSGLSARNTSTVKDLATFFAYVKHTQPHLLDITRLRMYISQRTGYVNNDPASALSSFVGGKNGYTYEAGRTFVGAFQSESGKNEIGMVILGSTDLIHDISILQNQGEKILKSSAILSQP